MVDGNPNSSAPPRSDEVNAALRRCWQPVARIEDLASGPRRAVLLGEALTVFLTESGKPAVLADRCPHRGASLSMGRVTGDGVQCPYHGWEWSGAEGVCTRVPSLPDQGQIPPRARVPAFPARLHWGLVWTVLEDPAADLPSLPWFNPETWAWEHGPPFELPVGFGVMIENFRDVAHFAFVHEPTFGRVPEVIEPLEPDRDGLEVTLRWRMRVGEGAEARQVWGPLREVGYHLIAPNFTSVRMFTDGGERCLLHAARAISATESAHYWIQGLAPGYQGGTLGEAIAFETRVYGEDRPIISAIEPRELSLDPSTEVSTLADRFTLAYRQAFAEFVRRAHSDGRAQSSPIAS